jgi:hypothetical protein
LSADWWRKQCARIGWGVAGDRVNNINSPPDGEPCQNEAGDPGQEQGSLPIPPINQGNTDARNQTASDKEETERQQRIAKVAKRRRRERRKRTAKTVIESLAALATVAIAGLTAAYVVYSGRQWHTMRDALEQSERAWILYDNATLDFAHLNRPGERAIIIDFRYKNFGKGPAFDLNVSAGWSPKPSYELKPSATECRAAPIAKVVNLPTIAPGQGGVFNGHIEFDVPPGFEELRPDLSKTYYMMFDLGYVDQFGKDHCTHVCLGVEFNPDDLSKSTVDRCRGEPNGDWAS